jgi:hypothetical protein
VTSRADIRRGNAFLAPRPKEINSSPDFIKENSHDAPTKKPPRPGGFSEFTKQQQRADG